MLITHNVDTVYVQRHLVARVCFRDGLQLHTVRQVSSDHRTGLTLYYLSYSSTFKLSYRVTISSHTRTELIVSYDITTW